MDDSDPKQIAQRGVDPITGSPLSSEVRKALFKSATISSSVFNGGGALVKSQRSTLSSENLQVINSTAQGVSSISQQIEFLAGEIRNLTNNLSEISNIIRQESLLEIQKNQVEEDNQRRLAEQEIRLGKENELERKIQIALYTPVQKVTNSMQDLFGRIQSALLFMFGGWLVNQGIELLKSYTEGNKEKFNEVRDNITKNLFYAGLTFVAANTGFSLFINGIRSIAFKLSGFVGKIISIGFQALRRTTSMIPGLSFLGPKPPTSTPTPSGGKPGGGKPRTPAPPGRGGGKGGLFGGLGNLFTAASGIMNLGSGEYTDAALAGLSLLGPGKFVRGAAGAAFLLDELSESFGGNLFGKSDNTPPKEKETKSGGASPLTQMMSPKVDEKNISQQPQQTSEGTKAQLAFNSEVNLMPMGDKTSEQSNITSEAPTPNITAAFNPETSISPTQQTLPNIGPIPDVLPNVVIASANGQQKPPGPSPSLVTKSATNTPKIKSSNPDNFYVMYSQVNYNVVV